MPIPEAVSDSKSGDGQRSRRASSLDWLAAIGGLSALLSVPALLSMEGESDGLAAESLGAPNGPGNSTLWSEWASFPLADNFGGTPSFEIAEETPGNYTMRFEVEVGRSAGPNSYTHFDCDGVPTIFDTDPSGDYAAVDPPLINTCTQRGVLTAMSGACCASEHGFDDAGQSHFGATFVGPLLHEVIVSDGPPPTASSTSVHAGQARLSTGFERMLDSYLATAYNTTLNQLAVYKRATAGSWAPLTTVPCDSPFSNYHWGTAFDPGTGRLWVGCRNGGPVQVTQINAATGATD